MQYVQQKPNPPQEQFNQRQYQQQGGLCGGFGGGRGGGFGLGGGQGRRPVKSYNYEVLGNYQRDFPQLEVQCTCMYYTSIDHTI